MTEQWDSTTFTSTFKLNEIIEHISQAAYEDGLNDAKLAVENALRCNSCACYGAATGAILDLLQPTRERDSQTDQTTAKDDEAGGDPESPSADLIFSVEDTPEARRTAMNRLFGTLDTPDDTC